MKPLFLQIHTLTSYPGSLLNRDDVGFAKRLPFGGSTRTRVSSQCLKRHWRRFEGEGSLLELTHHGEKVELAVRSRETFDRFVLAPLRESGFAEPIARAATQAVMKAVLGESAKARAKKAEAEASPDGDSKPTKGRARKPTVEEPQAESMSTGQVTILGRPEVAFFLAEARAVAEGATTEKQVEERAKERFGAKDWGKNTAGLRLAAGLDSALFGRMVTSDRLARADAAIHVAHAFTVHAEQPETDYFSAVDDLLAEDGEQGSGHINTTELTSGLFYGYTVVDVAQLVSNLEACKADDWRNADKTLAAAVVERLVSLVARVSPGAKLGSTAPYAYSHLVLVEAGASQPRTLANAFLAPVQLGADPLGRTFDALASYTKDVDDMYGLALTRALAAVGPKDRVRSIAAPQPLGDVASFAAAAVREASP